MNNLRRVKKLTIDDKSIYHRWLACHIAEVGKNGSWVNGATIYKHSLKFTLKAWWLVVRQRIVPTTNDNTLGCNQFLPSSDPSSINGF